jgi:hypothetical protein
MSRRCQCTICLEHVASELVFKPQNWCIKCYDEYVAVMATYRARHASADGKQLTLPVDTPQPAYPPRP